MSKYQPYANVKMKGKLFTLLPCKCCMAINKKKINKDKPLKEDENDLYRKNV